MWSVCVSLCVCGHIPPNLKAWNIMQMSVSANRIQEWLLITCMDRCGMYPIGPIFGYQRSYWRMRMGEGSGRWVQEQTLFEWLRSCGHRLHRKKLQCKLTLHTEKRKKKKRNQISQTSISLVRFPVYAFYKYIYLWTYLHRSLWNISKAQFSFAFPFISSFPYHHHCPRFLFVCICNSDLALCSLAPCLSLSLSRWHGCSNQSHHTSMVSLFFFSRFFHYIHFVVVVIKIILIFFQPFYFSIPFDGMQSR